jgi:hypothetical protein
MLAEAVATASALEFWLVSLMVAGLAAFLLRHGLRSFWCLRTIADIPTAKIRSAPQGYVELAGQALPQAGPVSGPLTGLPCVWYRFQVEERRGSGKNQHWVTVDQGEAKGPFLLNDGTGRCQVLPAGAELHCRAKDVWYGPSRHPSGPPERQWLIFTRSYRYTEERVVAGDGVYLLGRFETPRRGPEARERLTRHLLSAWKRDPARMRSFDRDGDGEISLTEWESARAKAHLAAERSERRLLAEPPMPQVLRTDDPRHPFVISTLGEGVLLRRLRLWAFGGTAAFLVLASGVGFAVLARLSQVPPLSP